MINPIINTKNVMAVNQMVLIIVLFASTYLYSCTSARNFKKSDYYVSKTDFVKSYKAAAICGCINELTNDSLKTFMINNGDNGLFVDIEVISYQTVKEADSVGRLLSKDVLAINYADAGYKKPIVSGCIKLGLTKSITEIAIARYRQMVNSFKREDK
jgi:hypothetical protein